MSGRSVWQKIGAWTYTFLLLLVGFLLALELNFLWLFGRMPSVNNILDPKLATASELYSADSVLLGKYFTENRSPVSYKDIAPCVFDALIATEDIRFYEHHGVDYRALGAAAFSTVSGDARGASTITQQLAKNLYKTRRGNSKGLFGHIPGVKMVIAKLKEWITSYKLEFFYTKNEILELYLNTVDFGNNAYGIKVAAKTYFNTSPKKLKVHEAALLVGMLKGTSQFNPVTRPKQAKARRNTVLEQMAKYDKISQSFLKRERKRPLGLRMTVDSHREGIALHFRSWLAERLKTWCEDNDYNLYEDGLRIYTTLDSRLQTKAEEAVTAKMNELQNRFYRHWKEREPWLDQNGQDTANFILNLCKKSPVYDKLEDELGEKNEAAILKAMEVPKRMKVWTYQGEKDTTFSSLDSIKYYVQFLQCGLMTIDPFTGHIKAWVGGVDYDHFKVDHVYGPTEKSGRPAGSTFKPFVYTTAFEQGMGPCDKMTDQYVSHTYNDPYNKGKETTWTPKNADGHFSGREMTLRHAMGRSINSVAAQLTLKVGLGNVAETARKLGISTKLDTVPAIGLGANDVKLFDMVGAYAAFVNQGEWIEPMFITHITDRNGKVIEEFKPQRRQAVSPETAYLMTYMFRGGLEEPGGTSQALFGYEVGNFNEMGGKTGTSQNYADGWYIGVTKELVTGVWTGCDEPRIRFRNSANGEGSKTALPVYGAYMDLVYRDPALGIKKGYWPKPTVEITKPWNCRTPWQRAAPDSMATDSLPPTDENYIPDELPTSEEVTQ